MEFKNGKLQLPNVTLVAMSSVNMMETVRQATPRRLFWLTRNNLQRSNSPA